MELLYKKKKLKFRKEIEKTELKFSREASRHNRLSILRHIDISDFKEDQNEHPKLGEKKTRIPSRSEMLKKWKEEKTLKQQRNLENKTVTKPGFCLKKPTSKGPERFNSTDSFKQNAQRLPNIAQRTGPCNIKPAPTGSKSFPQHTKALKPVASMLKSTHTIIKPQVTQKTLVSKPTSLPKSTVPKSGLNTLSLRTSALQGKSIPKDAKPSIQKPMKINAQSSKVIAPVTKITQKLPSTKSKPEKDVNVPFAAKPSKIAFPNRFKEPSSRILSKKNQATHIQKKGIDDKESNQKTTEIFSCDISNIEQSKSRKSFAPLNFMFCPPPELSFQLEFEFSSPSVSRLRSNGMQRTSSPLNFDEKDMRSSADDLSTNEMKDSVFDLNLLEEKGLEGKTKATPEDNKCQTSKSSSAKASGLGLEIEKDILEIKMGDIKTISACSDPDLVTHICPKIPIVTSGDIAIESIEKFPENGVEEKDAMFTPINVECVLPSSLFNEPVSQNNVEKPVGKVSMRQRKSKMPPRYPLESINESIESKSTPCATPKSLKKLEFDENFSPRRSARLSEKLNKSGSFESLLNIKRPEIINSLDLENIQPKTDLPERIVNKTLVSCKKKSKEDKDFTPRRSKRLSEILRKSSSYENLFDIRRPSVMESPCLDDFSLKVASQITYDFDNLDLEDSPNLIKKANRRPQLSKKVSLLYTPPARKSVLKSVKEDLMSFSPV